MRASEHPHSRKRQQKGPSRAPDGLKRAEVAERAAHGGPARVTRVPARHDVAGRAARLRGRVEATEAAVADNVTAKVAG